MERFSGDDLIILRVITIQIITFTIIHVPPYFLYTTTISHL